MTQPTLHSERLILRPFTVDDAPSVQQLAGDRAIADTTVNVPHPYEDGMAEAWIRSHEADHEAGNSARFALVSRASTALIGAMGLEIDDRNRQAELGYWIAVPFWNQGYATEAAREVVRFGFETLGLNRIGAAHFTRNPASGRVMQKLGMSHEGTTRQGAQRWDTFEDLERYGLLHSDWLERQS